MENIVLFKWRFTPVDYFEDENTLITNGYTFEIKAGTIEARIPHTTFDNELNMHEILHDKLNVKFKCQQAFNHLKYNLLKVSMAKYHSDGRVGAYAFGKLCPITVSHIKGYAIAKDKNGKIICDPRKERRENINTFTRLVEKHSPNDSLVSFLLEIYQKSVNNPENELIHLYEIRDALWKKFDGEKQAKKILKITKSTWEALGKIANNGQIKEGRHCGQSLGKMRQATPEELNKAREAALNAIKAYLDYLE